ncbi:MAG: tetratricopeptide repeat protein [Candidatus Thermoplasmatota archaeon]
MTDVQSISQPQLIGRDSELAALKARLNNALQSRGSTIFISGEAGIGKTRLVSELIKNAEANGAQIIRGWCLAESLEPLFPFKTAFREVGMHHLIAGAPPPKVISAYLMNEAGILAAKAEREESGLDPDIFTSMMKAVGDFVHDSLSMMGKGGRGINIIGYDRYQILLQSRGNVSLTCVIEGTQSEFLVDDMRRVLETVGDRLDGWSGEISEVADLAPKVSWLIGSGKYDGRFLVDDPKLKQENLFDNVLLGMQRASIERPIVLFLDDLQWADPTTLSLLHYLSRNTRKNRVLILGTYRPEDIMQSWDGRTHQLETAMQNMGREDLLERIELKRLSRSNTEALVNSSLGRADFGSAFYERVHKDTEGTPFFVLEVVKLLAEEGSIAQNDEGAWHLMKQIEKLDIPSKVYDVVKRRLDRLMKEQRRILDYASVVGEEFQSEIVGKAMGINRIHLLENLSEIEKTHRLIHSFQKKYRFDHAKIREVLYNGIIDELKQEYHRLIADTIAALHKDSLDEVISALAHHYYEAGDERAGEYLVKAGDKAKDGYANEEAIRLYQQALETIRGEEKLHVLEKLADVQALSGEYDKAIANLESAKGLADDNETKARTLRKTGDAYEKKGDFDKSLEVLAEAKELIGEGRTAEYGRICFSKGYPYWKKGELDKAMSLFQTALKTFEETGAEQKDIGNALRAMGNIHLSKGEYDDALQYYEKSMAVMEKVDDKYGIAAALNNIGIVHLYRGELEKALEYYGRSLEMFEKIGDKRGIVHSLCGLAETHLEMGKDQTALENAEKAVGIAVEIGAKSEEGMSRRVLGMVYREMKDWDKAEEEFSKARTILEDLGNKNELARLFYEYGLLFKAKGEPTKACEYLEKSLAEFERMGMKLWIEKTEKLLVECAYGD